MAWPGQQVGREGEQGRAWEGSVWLLQPGRWHKDGGGHPGRGAQRHWCHRMEEKEEEKDGVCILGLSPSQSPHPCIWGVLVS